MVSGTRGGVAASSGSCPDPERAERGDRGEGIVGEGKWGRVVLGFRPRGLSRQVGLGRSTGLRPRWAGGSSIPPFCFLLICFSFSTTFLLFLYCFHLKFLLF